MSSGTKNSGAPGARPTPPSTPGRGSWHAAFFRGINVGGHRKVPKAALLGMAESLGFADAISLLASGNLLYRTDQADGGQAAWVDAFETTLGWSVPVFCFPLSDLHTWIAEGRETFPEGGSSLYISFLQGDVSSGDRATLETMTVPGHEIGFGAGVAYVLASEGYRFSPFGNDVIEKTLHVTATTRKLTTVERLVAKAE